MTFHENRLLADDSHEISYLIFFSKIGNMSQNLSSAAVVIGDLRVIASASSEDSGPDRGVCVYVCIHIVFKTRSRLALLTLLGSVMRPFDVNELT